MFSSQLSHLKGFSCDSVPLLLHLFQPKLISILNMKAVSLLKHEHQHRQRIVSVTMLPLFAKRYISIHQQQLLIRSVTMRKARFKRRRRRSIADITLQTSHHHHANAKVMKNCHLNSSDINLL